MNTENTKNERPLFPEEIYGKDVWKIGNDELLDGYAKVYQHYSDQELVDEFNGFVGHCYNSVRVQIMRKALISELDNRKIDLSAIATRQDGQIITVKYSRAMKLVHNEEGKKLVGVGSSHLPKFKEQRDGLSWDDIING